VSDPRDVQADAAGYLMQAEQAYYDNQTMEEAAHPVQPTSSELHCAAAKAAFEDKQYAVAIYLAEAGLAGEANDRDRDALRCLLTESLALAGVVVSGWTYQRLVDTLPPLAVRVWDVLCEGWRLGRLELVIEQRPGYVLITTADSATDGPSSMVIVLPDGQLVLSTAGTFSSVANAVVTLKQYYDMHCGDQP